MPGNGEDKEIFRITVGANAEASITQLNSDLEALASKIKGPEVVVHVDQAGTIAAMQSELATALGKLNLNQMLEKAKLTVDVSKTNSKGKRTTKKDGAAVSQDVVNYSLKMKKKAEAEERKSEARAKEAERKEEASASAAERKDASKISTARAIQDIRNEGAARKEVVNQTNAYIKSLNSLKTKYADILNDNENLKASFDSLMERVRSGNLDSEGLTQFGKDFQALSDSLSGEKLKIKEATAVTKLNNDLSSLQDTYSIAISRNEQLEQSFARLYEIINGEGTVSDKKSAMADLKESLAEFRSNAEIGQISKMRGSGAYLYAMASTKNTGGKYNDYMASVKSFLDSLNDSNKPVSELSANLTELENEAASLGVTAQTAGQRFASLFKQRFSSMAIMMAFMKIRQALSSIYTNVVDVNAAMIELKKVTDETSGAYDSFLKRAATRATDIGVSLSDYINAVADAARLGYSVSDSEQIGYAATIYKNVGDGIESISDASGAIIAMMKAFNMQADEAIDIVDKYNEVGNNFAISSEGIGTALQKSASALYNANNSIDQSIALAVAGNASVQNPEVVGTALKTLSMYLRAAKEDAEDAGISTDGMAGSVSELRDSIMNLSGVDIMLNEDTFKSTYDILKEMSVVWGSLSDINQANLLELMGGKRNANTLSSILTNFKDAEAALLTAQNAENSAVEENEKYLQGIEGALTRLKSAGQELSITVLDDDALVVGINLLEKLLEVLTKITSVVGSGGVLAALIGGTSIAGRFGSANVVGTALTTSLAGMISPQDRTGVNTYLTQSLRGLNPTVQASLLKSVASAGDDVNKLAYAFESAGIKGLKFDDATGKVTASLEKNAKAAKSAQIGIVGWASIIATVASIAITSSKNAYDKAMSVVADAGSSAAELENTTKQIDSYLEKIDEASGNIDTLYGIKQDIIEQWGDEASAIANTTSELTKYLNQLKENKYSDWWVENSQSWYDAGKNLSNSNTFLRTAFAYSQGTTIGTNIPYSAGVTQDEMLSWLSEKGYTISPKSASVMYNPLTNTTSFTGFKKNGESVDVYELIDIYSTLIDKLGELPQTDNIKYAVGELSEGISQLKGTQAYQNYNSVLENYGAYRLMYGKWGNDALRSNAIGAYSTYQSAVAALSSAKDVSQRTSAIGDISSSADVFKSLLPSIYAEDESLGLYIEHILLPDLQSVLDANPLEVKYATPGSVGVLNAGQNAANSMFAGKTLDEALAIIGAGNDGSAYFKDIAAAAEEAGMAIGEYVTHLYEVGAVSAGVTPETNSFRDAMYKSWGESSEGSTAIDKLFVNGTINAEEYEKVLEEFPELYDDLINYTNIARDDTDALYEAQNKIQRQMSKSRFNKNAKDLSSWTKELKNAKKGSAEYNQLWGKIQKTIGDVGGTFEDTAENIALIEAAANGDESAISSLQDKLESGFLATLGLDASNFTSGLISVDQLVAQVGENAETLVDALTKSGMFTVETVMVSDPTDPATLIPARILKRTSDVGGSTSPKGGGGGGGSKSAGSKKYQADIKLLDALIGLLSKLTNYYVEGSDKWIERQMEIIDMYKAAAQTVEDEYNRLLASGKKATDDAMIDMANTLLSYQDSIYKESETLFDALRQNNIDAINDQVDAIDDLLEAEEKRWEKREEQLQHEIDQQESLVGLEQNRIDLAQTIRSEYDDLDKRLKDSMAMEAYTDESQRKYLFNEDDYNRLKGELDRIAEESAEIYADYAERIAAVDVEDTYMIEFITNEYERQYALKQKEYEIAKQSVELEKARLELENAQQNRNTRMLVNGIWQWVADPDKIREYTEKLAEAESAIAEAREQYNEQETLNNLEDVRDNTQETLAREEKEYEDMVEYWEDQKDMLQDQIDALEDLQFSMDNLANEIHDFTDTLQDAILNAISSTGKKSIAAIDDDIGTILGGDEYADLFNNPNSAALYDFGKELAKSYGTLFTGDVTSLPYGVGSAAGAIGTSTLNNIGGTTVIVNGISINDADGNLLVDIFRRNSII